jgi:signal transduction histidine kinase
MDNAILLRKKINTVFSLLSASVFVIFGLWYIFNTTQKTQGFVELVSGFVLFFNIYLLVVKNKIDLAGRVTTALVMAISVVVFVSGGIENTGNLWIILVPMFPLMILPYKEGIWWMLCYSIFFILVFVVGMAEWIELPFNFLELRQTMIVFVLFNILIFFSEKTKILAWKRYKASQKELRQKDHILYNQSKSAQMGEMLSMIAHQWRQPLNSISIASINLEIKQESGELSSEEFLKYTTFIQDQSQNMSKVIDDFMNFFKPDQESVSFVFDEMIDDLRSLMGIQLKNRNIDLVCSTKGDTHLVGSKKELVHILINLIANARDAYEQSPKDIQTIEVQMDNTQDDKTVILVTDHAGGISNGIIDRIFDPYFTTKDQGKGTGIGLYMSRKIVNEVIHGSLEIINCNDGACCTLTIPKSSS